MHKREGRESEHFLELQGKLIPNAGEAAILHEGADVAREFLCRDVHRSCGAHGHAVHHKLRLVCRVAEQCLGNPYPLQHVVGVLPPHLYVLALAQPVSVKVRHQYIVAQVAVIHPREVEELGGSILVTVHDYRSPAPGIVGTEVEGVHTQTVLHHHEGIPEPAAGTEAVHPGPHIRKTLIQNIIRAVDILPAGIGFEGEAKHVPTGAVEHCEQDKYDSGNYIKRYARRFSF